MKKTNRILVVLGQMNKTQNWRKTVFWLGITAFLVCMAWTILSGCRIY